MVNVMTTLTHVIIGNSITGTFIGVPSASPSSGAKVLNLDHTVGGTLVAYWDIQNVKGGQQITLSSNSALCLTLNKNPADNGTYLILGASAPISDVNLWSTGTKTNSGTGPTTMVLSLGQYLCALDAGGGLSESAAVWTPSGINTNQGWNFTDLIGVEDFDASNVK
jgi:hypothetical protein